MKLRVTILPLLMTAVVWTARPALAEIMVVVHPSNTISSLTNQQVENIFLGSSTTFPDGGNATPVEIISGNIREEFLSKVMGKTAGQVKAAWTRIIFSGKGLPPRQLPDAAGVKAFVAANPTAIGYINKASADASVKVVFTAP